MKKAFLGGALILAKMDGKEFSSPINADIVKKYYAWGNQEKWLAKVENSNGRLWQVKKKGQVKNLKRRLDQEKRFLDWKPEGAV